MNIEGSIESIVFRNEGNNFTVAVFDTSDGPITVVGELSQAMVGRHYSLEGEIVFHDKYGEQFKVESAQIVVPTSKEAIIKYLSSGILPHIGKKTAEKIYSLFGEDSLAVIEDDTDKLKGIPGLGKKRIKAIREAANEQKASREAILYLQSMGFGINQANKIYKFYKEDTVKVVSSDPYRLVEDISGIGFLIADDIAKKNGINLDSEFRIFAGVNFLLTSAANKDGDCYLELDDLLDRAVSLLNLNRSRIMEIIQVKLIEGRLIRDFIGSKEVIYYEHLYRAEDLVATRLIQIYREKIEKTFDFSYLEDSFLDLDQKNAVRRVFENKLSIITGGPGTGKTTLLKALVKVGEDSGMKIALCAPTGRAAKRLEESTEKSASTIHRLLKYAKTDQGYMTYEHDSGNPLEADLIIVDECSMIDIELMERLVDAVLVTSHLVLVGDVDQLPSVGPGNVLKDIIDSGFSNTIKLNKIYRQSEDSNIVINAHRINRGEMPFLNEEGKDFFFIDQDNPVNAKKIIIDLVKRRLPNHYGIDPLDDIQVLSVMKKGDVGTYALNKDLQEVLNPKGDELQARDGVFRVGDKVMQSVNNYNLSYTLDGFTDQGVFNGDGARIKAVGPGENELTLEFEDGKKVVYGREEIDELMHSYAITVHKSQGSEYKVLVMPIFFAPFMLMSRNILYTAVTRAKELVVLVGSREILKKMIENNSINRRNSSLAHRMAKKAQFLEEI